MHIHEVSWKLRDISEYLCIYEEVKCANVYGMYIICKKKKKRKISNIQNKATTIVKYKERNFCLDAIFLAMFIKNFAFA